MKTRKTSSTIMMALAMVALATPFNTQTAVAQSQLPRVEHANCAAESEVIRIEVGPNTEIKTLPFAINQAVTALEQCRNSKAIATVAILDGAGDQELPDAIQNNGIGTLKIVGTAKQISENETQRSKIKIPVNGSEFRRPVVLENVDITTAGVAIRADDHLSIINSAFTGTTKDSVAVVSKESTNIRTINIKENTFRNIKIWSNNSSRVEGVIGSNRVSVTSDSLPLIEVGKTKEIAGDSLRIIENDITVNRGADLSVNNAVVAISQPKVDIAVNTFFVTSSLPNVSGVSLFNPAEGDDPKNPYFQLNDVKIYRNVFSVATAISNSEKAGHHQGPGTANAVKINRNNFSPATHVLPKGKTVLAADRFDASCNHWSDGEPQGTTKRMMTQAVGLDQILPSPELGASDCVHSPLPEVQVPSPEAPAPAPNPGPQAPSPQAPNPGPGLPGPQVPPAGPQGPGTTPGGSGQNQPAPAPRPDSTPTPNPGPAEFRRVSGQTRFETGVAASQARFPNRANAVILTRGDVAADSVSAAPLAKELGAPILLTPSDQLHQATADEIRRVLPAGGTVYVMGGEQAVSNDVVRAVTALGARVERITGANRAATAVATAERLAALGKVSQVLLADGFDWQPDLIAGPAAAKVGGVTLLTNGASMAPETAAYLNANRNLQVTAIGDRAAATRAAAASITAPDPTELSVQVARTFLGQSSAVGVATTVDFADALVGGGDIAQRDGALILVQSTVPASVISYAQGAPANTSLYVYGGEQRISAAQERTLRAALQR